ncbi:MAG: hypothetical protein ABL901_04695 [Hyphomicrobiaceae bacterium]
MTEKRLRTGTIAYYWAPQTRDRRDGCKINSEPLGSDYGSAIERAKFLNTHLDGWRSRNSPAVTLAQSASHGTLDGLIERYKRSLVWGKVAKKGRPSYDWAFRRVTEMTRKSGGRVGAAPLTAFDAATVDRTYVRLQIGPRGDRTRGTVMSVQRIARAWDVVKRLHPKAMPVGDNPWRGVEMSYEGGTKTPATRAEAFALHLALIELGEPHLAAVPLICFEWHQRPENVLEGLLSWADYRPAARRDWVRVKHGKTASEGWPPIADNEGPQFPELTAYLDALPRLGLPNVLAQPRKLVKGGTVTRGQPRPFKIRYAHDLVAAARLAAGLPEHITLAACRHGGMTELGDAPLTEQHVMSLSQHKTPDAARLYVKRTESQRLLAARRRRAYLEAGLAVVPTDAQPIELLEHEQIQKSRNGS